MNSILNLPTCYQQLNMWSSEISKLHFTWSLSIILYNLNPVGLFFFLFEARNSVLICWEPNSADHLHRPVSLASYHYSKNAFCYILRSTKFLGSISVLQWALAAAQSHISDGGVRLTLWADMALPTALPRGACQGVLAVGLSCGQAQWYSSALIQKLRGT